MCACMYVAMRLNLINSMFVGLIDYGEFCEIERYMYNVIIALHPNLP